MTDEWTQTTLGQVADFINGYPFKPVDLNGLGLPVIRIKQLLDPSAVPDMSDRPVPDRHRIANGDLIFSWSGTLAARIWARGPALLNQHLFRVVERPGVSRQWLSYALEHAVADLNLKTHGSTMKHVTKGVLEAHPVVLPPLVVQRRIVDLMGHLDANLANLENERSRQEAMAKGLITDALSGATERDPARRAGFSVKLLPEIVDILDRYRKPVNGEERANRLGAVPYYGATGQAGWIDVPLFDEPLVLLGEDAVDFGSASAAKAYFIDGPSWVNNHAHVLRCDNDLVLPLVLVELLNRLDYSPYVAFGTRSKLTQANMRKIQLCIPAMQQQMVIQSMILAGSRLSQALSSEIASLSPLRRQLLNSLLTSGAEIPPVYDTLLAVS